MKKYLILTLILCAIAARPSLAFFHRAPVSAQTGKILRIDGTSFILRIDGTSKICRAGGC